MDPLILDSEIKIFSKPHALALALAEDFMQRAITSIQKKNCFAVALSGGNTPKLLFDALTSTEEYRQKIPWSKIKFFFGDERYLPQNDPNTNYNMVNTSLFSKLPILPDNIYPIPTEPMSPLDSAFAYEAILKNQLPFNTDKLPEFDLIYLGLGEDAHTASLMPHSNIVKYYAHGKSAIVNLVVALWVDKLNMYRVTLTPIIINNAQNVIFIVTGKNKALAVHQVLEDKYDPENYPAQLIRCVNNENIWYLDKEAASQLSIQDSSQHNIRN